MTKFKISLNIYDCKSWQICIATLHLLYNSGIICENEYRNLIAQLQDFGDYDFTILCD